MSSTPPPPPPSSAQSYPRPSVGPYRTNSGTTAAPGGGGNAAAPAYSRASPPLQQQHSATSAPPAGANAARACTRGCTAIPAHADPGSTPLTTTTANLIASLAAAVHESLSAYIYPDAIELAQRLFTLEPSYTHLHLLAHCYMASGALATAYRLLHHYYPFFELHVTRPRTAAAAHSSASGAGGFASPFANSSLSPTTLHRAAEADTLPLDGRRTWTAPAAGGGGATKASSPFSSPTRGGAEASLNRGAGGGAASNSSSSNSATSDVFDLSYETVDLRAQWDCQYLLGVCCYRTQHYEDGVKVLSQLLYVKHQLDTAVAALRRQQQQQQQQQGHVSADFEAAAQRQLQAYAFATETRTSQVLYWLGLCEKHRQRPPIAADHLRRAFIAHPTRLDAFQEYVRLAWPTEATVQDLVAVREPLAEEEEEEQQQQQQRQQRPPQRRGRETEQPHESGHSPRASAAPTPSSPTRHGGAALPPSSSPVTLSCPRLTGMQRRCVQQHLQPFLRALYLGITYRCPEAVEALQGLLQQQQRQQQQQQAAQTRTNSPPPSSVSAAAGGTPATVRAGLTRTPPWPNNERACRASEAANTTSSSHAATSPSVSPSLLRQLALAQFHNGDVQESAETFERLLRAAPWDLTNTALIYYSTALWHLKSESALGSLAQRLTDAEPFSPTTCCVVANAYSLIKDPRDALVMLKRAVQVAPTLAYAHALYGYELLGQDNKAEAEQAFKTALAVDQTLYIAYAGLGERCVREEQVDKARGYYKEAVELNPTPAIMNRFALTFHRQSNSPIHLKCALRLYSESLQRHPNNITARRQRADVLRRLDKPEEAVEELKALLVQCPGEAVIYITLAECMVSLRRPQEALQHFQTAIHLDPHRESYVQGCIDRLVSAKML